MFEYSETNIKKAWMIIKMLKLRGKNKLINTEKKVGLFTFIQILKAHHNQLTFFFFSDGI